MSFKHLTGYGAAQVEAGLLYECTSFAFKYLFSFFFKMQLQQLDIKHFIIDESVSACLYIHSAV